MEMMDVLALASISQRVDNPRWLMNRGIYEKYCEHWAKESWREFYRAARILGNRELAFDRIGDRRRGFVGECHIPTSRW